MAEQFTFTCDRCGRALDAWSDGNPYYLDENGAKAHAWHPRHELLARCIGNDVPHLCLGCGDEVLVDSRDPVEACPRCDASQLVDCCALGGVPCPWCQAGILQESLGMTALS